LATLSEPVQQIQVLSQSSQAESHAGPMQQQYHLQLQRTLQVSTYWQSAQEFHHMEAFFTAEKKYVVENNELVPIVLVTKKLGVRCRWQSLFATQFEYQYANINHQYNFSNDKAHEPMDWNAVRKFLS